VPAGATKGTIRITTPGGPVVTSSKFTVTESGVPTVAGFSPTSGRVQTTVVITGTGFTGGTTARFNGTNAWVILDSDTQIRATVPVGATTGKITVANSRGEVLTTSKFTVLKPTITSVSPYANPGWYEISGSALTGVTDVTIAGVEAHIVGTSDASITVEASGRKKGKVVVTTPGGTAKSSTGIQLDWFVAIGNDTAGYRYSGDVPAKPGDQLQIIGAFPGAASVRFNGRPGAITGVTSLGWADVVTVTVPVDVTGGAITITDATGTHTLPVSFTLEP
jgi:large repetitive protein